MNHSPVRSRDVLADAPPDVAGVSPARRASRCRYLVCTLGRAPVEIDIHDYRDPFEDVFLAYYVGAFRAMEACSEVSGLTFCIVWNSRIVPGLPCYGDDVVAVLLQDEACTVPAYAERVRFVFKAYGFRPWLRGYLHGWTPASLLKLGKNIGQWAHDYAMFAVRNGRFPSGARGAVIPLGYARQRDLPVRDLFARPYLVSFTGSMENEVHHRFGWRALVGTAKGTARRVMLEQLRRMAARYPGRVRYATTDSFQASIRSDGEAFSEVMAGTRICLAPRGSSVETYRFFEGLRQGCIVVCDRLPPHWFYVGCPAVQLDDWRELGALVEALLADPARMLALHEASLAWWRTRCSEEALGRMMAACLGAPAGATT